MADTLVVILCETRAFRLCQDKFKENLLDQMNCDLALCVGINKNTEKEGNKYYSYAKYIWEVDDPPDCGPVYTDICLKENGDPNWKDLLNIEEDSGEKEDLNLGGIRTLKAKGSGAYLYYYRWLLLQQLRREELISKYKWFIITRSDFIWNIPHPNTSILNDNYIYIPDGEKYGGITDRHTILPAKYVETYLNIIHPIIHNPLLVKNIYNDLDHINPECFIKWWLEYNNIYKYVKYFPYIMYSVREKNGSTSWSKGDWSEENMYYIKYSTEFNSYKKFSNIIHNQEYWKDLLS